MPEFKYTCILLFYLKASHGGLHGRDHMVVGWI